MNECLTSQVKKMIDVIKRYPVMIEDSIQITKSAKLPKYAFDEIRKIIICGMGGSAIGGELIRCLLRPKIKVPIEVSKQYHLPAYANKDTLVFCVSYSGNTEETLSQFVDALHAGCKTISITSGGKLEDWSNKLHIGLVKIPRGYQPRVALPYLFFPMLLYIREILTNDVAYDKNDIIWTINNINLDEVNEVAKELVNKQIAVYTSDAYEAVAIRTKTQLNENSKTHSRFAVFPELDHNEIVGYQSKGLNSDAVALILRDRDEEEEIRERIEITKKIIGEKARILEIWAEGKNKFTKLISLLYKTDYLSLKLAELYNVDPEPVTIIENLKKQLSKNTNYMNKLEKKLF